MDLYVGYAGRDEIRGGEIEFSRIRVVPRFIGGIDGIEIICPGKKVLQVFLMSGGQGPVIDQLDFRSVLPVSESGGGVAVGSPGNNDCVARDFHIYIRNFRCGAPDSPGEKDRAYYDCH